MFRNLYSLFRILHNSLSKQYKYVKINKFSFVPFYFSNTEIRHVIIYLCVDVLQIANTLMDNANKGKRSSSFFFYLSRKSFEEREWRYWIVWINCSKYLCLYSSKEMHREIRMKILEHTLISQMQSISFFTNKEIVGHVI